MPKKKKRSSSTTTTTTDNDVDNNNNSNNNSSNNNNNNNNNGDYGGRSGYDDKDNDNKNERMMVKDSTTNTAAAAAAVAVAVSSPAKKKRKKLVAETPQNKSEEHNISNNNNNNGSSVVVDVSKTSSNNDNDNNINTNTNQKTKTTRKFILADPEMKEAIYQFITCQMTANDALQSLTTLQRQQQENQEEEEEKEKEEEEGDDDTFKQPPTLKTFYGYANEIAKSNAALLEGFKEFESAKDVRKYLMGITNPQVKACKTAMIKLGINRYYDNLEEKKEKTKMIEEAKKKKPKTSTERSADWQKKHSTEINNKKREDRAKKTTGLYVVNRDNDNGPRKKKKKKNLKVATVSKSIVCIRFIKATTLMKEYSDKLDVDILQNPNIEPTKKDESFPDANKRPEEVNPTKYDNYHFCDYQALHELEMEFRNNNAKQGKEFTKLGVLGNAEFGLDKTKFHKFDTTLESVRDVTLRSNVNNAHKFKSITAHLYLSKYDLNEDDGDDITDVINDNDDTLFQYDFRMCEIHDSKIPIEQLEFYPEHKDKIGNLVTFWGTSGYSYNFIVYPRDKPLSKDDGGGDVTAYGIEKADGTSWKEYDEWRQQLQEQHNNNKNNTTAGSGSGRRCTRNSKKDDFERLEIFESTLLSDNKGSAYFGIRVYKVCKGDRLIFPAKYYKHGTVVPKQDTKRVLAILYYMQEQKTSLRLIPKKKKKKG